MTGAMEEAAFQSKDNNLELIPAKIGAIQFRIHGILDRMQAAAKRLVELITRMESRIPRGPTDFEREPQRFYLDYSGGRGPTPEPSWQTSLLGKIVAPLIVIGIPAILAALWNMNSLLSELRGDNKVIVQRLDQQDEHLKATDARVEEIKRELWPHKH